MKVLNKDYGSVQDPIARSSMKVFVWHEDTIRSFWSNSEGLGPRLGYCKAFLNK
jgi:hypothetical protein